MSSSPLEAVNSLSLEVMGRSSRPTILPATSLTPLYNQILSRFFLFKLTGSWCMAVQLATAAGWSQSLLMLPSSRTPQCKPSSTSTRCSGRESQQCSQAPSRISSHQDSHHRPLCETLLKNNTFKKESLLWTLLRVNAALMAALRQLCPVKISLTLPAGVVLPAKNWISFPTMTSGDVSHTPLW